MKYDLDNKVILITGGNGLLGKEMVNLLKQNGAIVINADINAETRDDLSSLQCDVTDEQQVKRTFERIFEKYNRIDGLVNNAYPRTKDWGLKFEDIPYSSWQKNIDMQLNSYFLFIQQACSYMEKNGGGSIVNIASIYGVTGPDFTVYEGTQLTNPAAYSAIKGGLINLTRYVASYFGAKNIRVNCISPGGIFDHQPETFVKNYEKKVPLKRMGFPDDISGPVAFLLSDAAKYITGQNLIVDGGWTCI
jgi:NAD(P)-dependent dehydrogenase (short-subunit alcohol dehydrogenase family)